MKAHIDNQSIQAQGETIDYRTLPEPRLEMALENAFRLQSRLALSFARLRYALHLVRIHTLALTINHNRRYYTLLYLAIPYCNSVIVMTTCLPCSLAASSCNAFGTMTILCLPISLIEPANFSGAFNMLYQGIERYNTCGMVCYTMLYRLFLHGDLP